jgi:peptide/nickel transport system substrate-binding protein
VSPRALAVAAALLLTGAAQAQTAPPRSRTVVVAQTFDPQSLWPNATTASDNINAGAAIVESLFWANPATGKIEPLLGESFAQVDPTTVRIVLRRGVSFTNGERMDADAAVASIKVFADPKQSPAYGLYSGPIASVDKIDDRTVELHTKFPTPSIGTMLTQIFITPPKYWTTSGIAGYGQKPVGTGPYVLSDWRKDDRVVMDRNPAYWGKAPQGIDRVVWRPVPDDTARAAGLQTGEYDLTSALAITDVTQLETQPDVQVIGIPSYRIYTISLSSLEENPGPLHDKRVRQALNYAVDKQSIIKNILFGRAQPLHGQLLRHDQIGFDPSIADYPFDPARAKKLLAEAGYPNGFDLVFKTPSGRYPQDREVSQAVAGMLAQVGVRTDMQTLEPGEFLRQLRNRELAPMAFVGLAPPDDPDYQLLQYRSTWRYAYVHNPQIDALVDAGARDMDPASRGKTYQQLMKLMYDEVPVVFLYQGMDFYGATRRLKNFAASGDGRLFLMPLSLDAQ